MEKMLVGIVETGAFGTYVGRAAVVRYVKQEAVLKVADDTTLRGSKH